MLTPIRRTLCVVLLCGMLQGCGVVVADDPLENKLGDLKDRGQSAPLREITEFDWDEVHLFNEYTRREVIEEHVGQPVISADRHQSGSLLVFELNGEVVKTVTVSGDYLRGDEFTYGPEVRVVPWGAGALRLE
ncbi:hypothetical protein [Mycolicibacterium thermoresistibile]